MSANVGDAGVVNDEADGDARGDDADRHGDGHLLGDPPSGLVGEGQLMVVRFFVRLTGTRTIAFGRKCSMLLMGFEPRTSRPDHS